MNFVAKAREGPHKKLNCVDVREMVMASELDFTVLQYMYCHPDTVVVRRGRPKVLRWQHLIGVQGLILTLAQSAQSDSSIDYVSLHFRQHVFEQLNRQSKVIGSQHFLISRLDTWIAFKWTTRKGNTQFQVRLDSEEATLRVARLLERNGCRVEHKQPTLWGTRQRIPRGTHDFSTKAEFVSLLTGDARGQGGNEGLTEDLQLTQTQNTVTIAPHKDAHAQSQRPSCSQRGSLILQHEDSQTQVEPGQWNAPSEMSLSSAQLPAISVVSVRTSTFPHRAYTSSANSSTILPQSTAGGRYDEIGQIVRRKRALHLPIESYAYAELHRARGGTTEGSKWFHVGLASDICLSLLPVSGAEAQQPLVLLTRGPSVLAEFVPHPGYLKVYHTNDLLGLRQRGATSSYVSSHVQLRMSPEHVRRACEWLSFWEVHIEEPTTHGLDTESTHLSSSRPRRPWSIDSSTSRVSRSSRVSRHSLRMARAVQRIY